MHNNGVTALLFMKAHSTRIPGKNIKPFGGKPLCFHILQSLSQSNYVKQILVDTDSDEIAELVSDSFPKIKILERPEHLRGSKVPATPLIEHDLTFAKYEHFIQNHATTPMISPKTLDLAIEKFFSGLKKGFDSLIGVNKHHSRFYRADGSPLNHDPEIMVPSQDMVPIYEDNSNFYINSVNNFYKYKNRIGKKPFFFEVSKIESLDIDEVDDFTIAEAVYNFLNPRTVS
jgi:N-acylneuraminate cytidylyltransferase